MKKEIIIKNTTTTEEKKEVDIPFFFEEPNANVDGGSEYWAVLPERIAKISCYKNEGKPDGFFINTAKKTEWLRELPKNAKEITRQEFFEVLIDAVAEMIYFRELLKPCDTASYTPMPDEAAYHLRKCADEHVERLKNEFPEGQEKK